MLVDDWVEALAIGDPYPALVFSGPCCHQSQAPQRLISNTSGRKIFQGANLDEGEFGVFPLTNPSERLTGAEGWRRRHPLVKIPKPLQI
jgi:hypothetical protein